MYVSWLPIFLFAPPSSPAARQLPASPHTSYYHLAASSPVGILLPAPDWRGLDKPSALLQCNPLQMAPVFVPNHGKAKINSKAPPQHSPMPVGQAAHPVRKVGAKYNNHSNSRCKTRSDGKIRTLMPIVARHRFSMHTLLAITITAFANTDAMHVRMPRFCFSLLTWTTLIPDLVALNLRWPYPLCFIVISLPGGQSDTVSGHVRPTVRRLTHASTEFFFPFISPGGTCS